MIDLLEWIVDKDQANGNSSFQSVIEPIITVLKESLSIVVIIDLNSLFLVIITDAYLMANTLVASKAKIPTRTKNKA